ncbi:MAG: adenine phosphoribosyltransferase [Xanthomonadaceae bacterium]|nr:adenine phosphoribosyltransferase [Xanthomonadaceae bacterium]
MTAASHDTVESVLTSLIRDVPDFPKPGIVFKDITPLLEDAAGFRACIEALAARVSPHRPDALVAIESRGFIFGAPLALHLGLPLIVVRKPGKLPRATESVAYQLEYGEDRLEVHADAIRAGHRYALVDDVLATGGTAEAVTSLITRLGGQMACAAFPLELGFLGGRARLAGAVTESLVRYG